MEKNSFRMQRLLDNKLIVRDAFLMIVFPRRPPNKEFYATTVVFMPQLSTITKECALVAEYRGFRPRLK